MSEATPWLTQDQLEHWLHLTAALVVIPTAVEQQLKRDSGLSYFEYSVLAGLGEAPGQAMQMSDLAGCVLGSPSRLSHAVTRLERAGWVARRNPPDGSRTVEAALTTAGRAKIIEAAPDHVREVRRLVVDALTDEELRTVRDALRKILAITAPRMLDLIDHRAGASPCTGPHPPTDHQDHQLDRSTRPLVDLTDPPGPA